MDRLYSPSCLERLPGTQTSESHDSDEDSHCQNHANPKTTPGETATPYWKRDGVNATRKCEWEVSLALEKYLDERGGRITDPAGAYNNLENRMVKNALPHFSLTRERARKNQTPISDHTLELVRNEKETGHSEGPW